jgi:hypothetical protein
VSAAAPERVTVVGHAGVAVGSYSGPRGEGKLWRFRCQCGAEEDGFGSSEGARRGWVDHVVQIVKEGL